MANHLMQRHDTVFSDGLLDFCMQRKILCAPCFHWCICQHFETFLEQVLTIICADTCP